MKVAFTFNVRASSSMEEAEFDSPETIERLAQTLRELGHQVANLEAGGPVAHLVARLDALAPDLVLNLAEGKRGRFREGFYPALFEQMGLPYTGSDAYTCTLTLDKHLTKLALLERGLPVAPWFFVRRAEQLEEAVANLKFPLIVKPNFEGSSMGVTQESVAASRDELEPLLERMLASFPAGLMVEEFIEGKDVTVPFLGELLEPCELQFPEGRRYSIYDHEAKHERSAEVSLMVPARVDEALRERILDYTARTLRATGLRDFGRVDFRVSEAGKAYVIEVDALPNMRPGSALYAAARHSWAHAANLSEAELTREVLGKLIELACLRHGLDPQAEPPATPALRVGVAYTAKSLDADELMLGGSEKELEATSAIEAVMAAVRADGHEPVAVEADVDFAQAVSAADLDLVLNIAAGSRGLGKATQVPAVLELLRLPYTGATPACLCLSLDKELAKRLVAEAGVATPRWLLMSSGNEPLPPDLSFPLIAKPHASANSDGAGQTSVVETEIALRAVVGEMIRRHGVAALVEKFVAGREFRVGLLGDGTPKVLPVMEIVFDQEAFAHPIYGREQKLAESAPVTLSCPADLQPDLQAALVLQARAVFKALGCRDAALIDFRLDSRGAIHFLECNPLPGLAPQASEMVALGQAAGLSYNDLVRDILAGAIGRARQARVSPSFSEAGAG